MKNYFKQILQDLRRGENIDLFMAITLALLITALSVLGIASTFISQVLPSLTLAMLGLVALGLLITRYKINELHEKGDTDNLVSLFTKTNNFAIRH